MINEYVTVGGMRTGRGNDMYLEKTYISATLSTNPI
jgi:hypothetical protein